MNLDTVSPALSFYHLLQNLSPEELAGLKTSLAQYFMEGPGKASGVTCLYFVEEGQRSVVRMAGAGVHVSCVLEPGDWEGPWGAQGVGGREAVRESGGGLL